jgi:hypothetical protein
LAEFLSAADPVVAPGKSLNGNELKAALKELSDDVKEVASKNKYKPDYTEKRLLFAFN